MTAPTPLDQDDLAARATDAGVPVEFDADHAYATIGGHVYRARLAAVTEVCQACREGVPAEIAPCTCPVPVEPRRRYASVQEGTATTEVELSPRYCAWASCPHGQRYGNANACCMGLPHAPEPTP